MHLVGFTIEIYYDARPYERQILKPVLRLASCAWGKVIAIPAQAYYRPKGFQKVEAPRFQDNRHMKVVCLSDPPTGPPYPNPPPPPPPPGIIPGIHFCYRLIWPQGRIAAEKTPVIS